MSRPLLALAVVAAASVVGVWIQAATHGASRPVPTPAPTALMERAEIPTAAPERTQLALREAEPKQATPSTASHRLGAAVRVAADPATGQLTAPEHSGTALTIAQMQDLARQEAAGLVTIRNPDGSETLNHEGRFTDHTVIRIGPDGRRVFQCVHGRSAVGHALSPAAPMTPNSEDR
jgi:hypothetical protein